MVFFYVKQSNIISKDSFYFFILSFEILQTK